MSNFISRQAISEELQQRNRGLLEALQKVQEIQDGLVELATKNQMAILHTVIKGIETTPTALDPDKVIVALHRRYYTRQRERVRIHGLCKAMDTR